MCLSHIKTIYETIEFQHCNKLIQKGWILVSVNQYSKEDIEFSHSCSLYVLGNTDFLDISEVEKYLYPNQIGENGIQKF